MKKENFEVGMIHKICVVCCQKMEDQSEVIFNNVLTQKAADNIRKLHDQVVGFADKMCEECWERIDQPNGVYIIGIIEEKSDDPRCPYRSGHIVGVTVDAFRRMHSEDGFNLPRKSLNQAIERRACFMDLKVMKALGLIDQIKPESIN